MCREASIVLTRTAAYWSRHTDSHEEIMAEHGLREGIAGKIMVARVEITPPDVDMSAPPNQWAYKLDQDRAPDWYDAEREERRARKALKAWYAARVITGERAEITRADGTVWVIGGTVGTVHDGGNVRTVCDGGVVYTVGKGGIVRHVFDGGIVGRVGKGGIVRTVCDGGTVRTVCDGGTVRNVYDGGIVWTVRFGGIVRTVYGGGIVDDVYEGGIVGYTKNEVEK